LGAEGAETLTNIYGAEGAETLTNIYNANFESDFDCLWRRQNRSSDDIYVDE
jgi:hypothetical protein